MDPGAPGAISPFSDRVLRLLERVEHRCAKTPAEKEAAYRIRYDAYLRQQLIDPRASQQLFDEDYDNASNAWITLTYIDGELASTVRVNVASDENGSLPSLSTFSDVIMPYLRMGRVVVDMSRLAARVELAKTFPELPYLSLRPLWQAAEYFDADWAVANVLRSHLAFYRLTFGYTPWTEPRDYFYANCKTCCMGLDVRAVKERVEARYPFFRSTPAERDALFGARGEHPDPARGIHNGQIRTPAHNAP
jgi:hypothetical protein